LFHLDWERASEVLATIVIMSFLVERTLAVVFESKWFVKHFEAAFPSPGYQSWQGPGFRDKDGFENYLWFHVCKNKDLTLKDAQIQIAVDWRHYWEVAGKPECRNRQSCE